MRCQPVAFVQAAISDGDRGGSKSKPGIALGLIEAASRRSPTCISVSDLIEPDLIRGGKILVLFHGFPVFLRFSLFARLGNPL
jgi:hypothetical protein